MVLIFTWLFTSMLKKWSSGSQVSALGMSWLWAACLLLSWIVWKLHKTGTLSAALWSSSLRLCAVAKTPRSVSWPCDTADSEKAGWKACMRCKDAWGPLIYLNSGSWQLSTSLLNSEIQPLLLLNSKGVFKWDSTLHYTSGTWLKEIYTPWLLAIATSRKQIILQNVFVWHRILHFHFTRTKRPSPNVSECQYTFAQSKVH